MKLFIRDKEAIDTALFSSLISFKHKYKDFAGSHDLEGLYHAIRSDAMRKARSNKATDLKLYVEEEGAKEEATSGTNNIPEKPAASTRKSKLTDEIGYELEEETTKVTPQQTNDIDLRAEIKKLQAEGFDKPAKIRKRLEEIYGKPFDQEEVKKIHYKLLGK